jgi:membrane associated rhomboid family serine protease/Zn-finger nucleic acid-binding protein
MRACPQCSSYLVPLVYEAVHLGHCHRCGGTWLDGGDGPDVLGPAADPAQWDPSGAVTQRREGERRCPVDGERLEVVGFAHGGESLEVDHCLRCHGLWLDRGEAKHLQSLVSRSHQEREDLEPGFWMFLVQAVSGTPIEVWNPVRRKPWVTYGLIAALCVIYGYELSFLGDDEGLRRLIEAFGYTPAHVLTQPWTLVTYALLHGGLLHLLGNAYFLYVFGDNIEDTLGRRVMLSLFIVTASLGALAQNLVSLYVPVVGASGAVAGLMGAYVVLFPHVKVYVVLMMARIKMRVLWYMGIWVALQFLIALQQDSPVAWMVHLGGFAAGALLAWPLRRKGLDAFVEQYAKPRVERRLSVAHGLGAVPSPKARPR